MKRLRRIDKVRASRDGHEFHEAWAARKALQLVVQLDGLVGIAVEGLAPLDQQGVSDETVEIADLVLYYGKSPTFDAAESVAIIQFKYSKSLAGVPYRASEIKKTIRKFAQAYRSYKKKHGTKEVDEKLSFELITNRPIHPGLIEAIKLVASGTPLTGDAKKQAGQFVSASGLGGKEVRRFAQKVAIIGRAGSLTQNKQALSRVIADWSVAPDAFARARLGAMRQLLRDKAGLAGQGRNLVTRTDVLDVLEVQSPDDLFPCRAGFPRVGKVVRREQLTEAAKLIPKLDKPLLIHAAGGVGKTVFLQSLSKVLSERHETVVFDCFGGGAYRAPDDARHLPKRGLVHIINKLACRGFCDPLLPVNENVEDLIKAFRIRLAQVVTTLRRGSRGKKLCLFLDAIDNAAEHAKDKGEEAFPTLLLESFHHRGPVPGVRIIASCRTHRRDVSRGNIPCEEFELEPFSTTEAEVYLRERIQGVTETQVHVAYSRSEGNPRILEHLALSDRGLLDSSEINKVIKLDDLLKARIQKALQEARTRGYKENDINAFLAGLAVLPPPVPIEEYAAAHGMEVSAIKSFAADLAPLLEHTRHGLMFRDEPTETLIKDVYAANADTLRSLAENLFKRQDTSVYAASALPGLLQKLDDGRLLFKLAFDERFPSVITGAVGKQNIRYARLKAAVTHAAGKRDFDALVQLLVELSTLAAVNERGTDYVLQNPDLVIASHDIDATRRLFETRTRWPGTRHARVAIGNILSGDLNDAYRHGVSADEWIDHFYRQDDEYRRDKGGPERLDIACIPLCLLAQNRGREAGLYIQRWKPWYAFEAGEHIFGLLHQAQAMESISLENGRKFVTDLKSQPAMLAAALAFGNSDTKECRRLVKELAELCQNEKPIEANPDFYRERECVLADGLLKAAAIALEMKMRSEALAIVSSIASETPRLWSFTDRFPDKTAFAFVVRAAVRLAAHQQPNVEHHLLPRELADIGGRIPRDLRGEAFRKALGAELDEYYKQQQKLADDKKQMSYDEKKNAERFITERLEPLAEICEACVAMLSCSTGVADKAFLKVLTLWRDLRKQRGPYSDPRETNIFFDFLGRQLLVFFLWARCDLKLSSVEAFVASVTQDSNVSPSTLIRIIAILAKRPLLQELAGKAALQAKVLIEREDEVDRRASLFAQLSRAILPASFDEASAYFSAGLEQMDAIGSGDYQFTNELLLFAASLKGSEIGEADFHTLSNICELNMPSEEEKFPWPAFARAFSRCSGLKILAKLGRWNDRDKISLDYTLLPYVAALIEDDKIDPAMAVALLRLSNPTELYFCGTEQVAELIEKKRYSNSKELIAELILQFGQNNPGVFMPSTVATLSKITEREWGKESDQASYLSAAAPLYETLRNEENECRNYRGPHGSELVAPMDDSNTDGSRALKRLQEQTDPADEESLSRALDDLGGMQRVYNPKVLFLESMRSRVKFADRAKYVQVIARHQTLDIYTKLHELEKCKAGWSVSSQALEGALREVAFPLLEINADDFVTHDYLSHSNLRQLSDISGIAMSTLALELMRVFAAPDVHVPASIWMGLATIVCEQAQNGTGQAALGRLLNSNSAKLASTVVDGEWKDGVYPKGGQAEIAAGLIWLQLGSPWAASRWRAAHAIRSLARLDKWEVINTLVARFDSLDAHPFQAPELRFYFLHARLWLLIALARIAMDHPQNIGKYAEMLEVVALSNDLPHVLFRHFASEALLTCADKRALTLPEATLLALKTVNRSPFPQQTTEGYMPDSFYHPRPRSTPEPKPEFHLDYDFDKTDVSSLSSIFARSRWETKDAMTAWVRKYDPQITSMYDLGGRSRHWRDRAGDMDARHHLYGQQLGWHALFFVAGEFLTKYASFERPYGACGSWDEWLGRELLTRSDGLWLADGIDRPPLDAQTNLYEKGETGLVITGNKRKLLALLGIRSPSICDLVVGGYWHSNDDVEIRVGSAIVPARHAKKVAQSLAKEDPFRVWLPRLEEYEDGEEFSHSTKVPFEPWVVWPSAEARLDGTDPLGANSVVRRPHLAKVINEITGLQTSDPFRRTWTDSSRNIMVRSEAWGRNRNHDGEDHTSGERLVCGSHFVRNLLAKLADKELFLLLVLRRYEKSSGDRGSQYWHTTGVVRLKKSLDWEFYPGVVNALHEMKY